MHLFPQVLHQKTHLKTAKKDYVAELFLWSVIIIARKFNLFLPLRENEANKKLKNYSEQEAVFKNV